MKESRFWPVDDRLVHWHPVALLSDLGDRPLPVMACGVPVVLFRTPDSICAVYDRCPHRRAPLSRGRIEGGRLVCIYHGCSFTGDGRGYCPTTRSNRFVVPRFEIRTLRKTIWIRLPQTGERSGVESDICPALMATDIDFAGVVLLDVAAPLQLVVDNMTELEHTGEVHRTLAFGTNEYDSITTGCREEGDTVVIDYAGQQRPLPFYLRALTGVRIGDYYVQRACVAFTPPHASYDIHWEDRRNAVRRDFALRFVVYYTPVTSDTTRLFVYVFWSARDRLRRTAMAVAAPILRQKVRQELGRDKAIIETLPQDEANLQMFQLRTFDRPLVMTRAAMARLYPEGGERAHLEVTE